jgi:hypothetical protein
MGKNGAERAEWRIRDTMAEALEMTKAAANPIGAIGFPTGILGRAPDTFDADERFALLASWVSGLHQELLRAADEIEALRSASGGG